MGTRTRFARNLFSAVLGLGLLSLMLLGSPGCGCGDDDLLPPGDRVPGECCCDFEWLPPRIAGGSDVVLSIENADPGLGAVVTPTLFTSVNFTVAETFTVCVSEEHPLGNQLELVFTDQATNEEYGRAMLQYKTRCLPGIEPLSDGLRLTSTDCGGGEPLTCCCELDWRPNPNQVGNVELVAQGATAGLDPVITPSAINGVTADAIYQFDVCVDVDHPLPAQFDLVIRQAGGGAVLGGVQLVYDERCTPTFVPTTAIPALDITSTDCGGDPLRCCCEFEWLPPAQYSGNVNITAESASTGLNVAITPSTINGVVPRTVYNFDVCVDADHNLGDTFQLVITDTGGTEVGRALVTYDELCTAVPSDIVGTPGLFLSTTDCGGASLQCCCDFEWILTDPDFNPPGSPWSVTLENVDPSLETASVSPTSIVFASAPPTTVVITICVNPAHTSGAALDLVVRDATGAEMARLPMDYVEPCIPITGDPSGAGTWINLCQGPD